MASSELLPAVRQTFRLPTLRKPARFSEVPPLHRPFISVEKGSVGVHEVEREMINGALMRTRTEGDCAQMIV